VEVDVRDSDSCLVPYFYSQAGVTIIIEAFVALAVGGVVTHVHTH